MDQSFSSSLFINSINSCYCIYIYICKKKQIEDEIYYCGEDRLVYLNMAKGKKVDCNGQDFYEWECVECFSTKERRQNMEK